MTTPPRSAVRAAVREAIGDLTAGERILVALSGGADSLALAEAAVRASRQTGLVCEAVVVDHQLQSGSELVTGRAAEQALILGCDRATVVPVDVPSGPGSGGPEAAARTARHAALIRSAQGPPQASAILLGHTMDDQAETVLLGLARGSGARSLAGMAPRSGLLRRPLLGLRRSMVAAAAERTATEDPRLRPWTDPHNVDPAYARVRVRLDALPALVEALGTGVVPALARTADLARDDADALEAWAGREWERLRGLGALSPGPAGPAVGSAAAPVGSDAEPADGHSARLDLGALAVPPAVATRVLRRFLIEAGCPASALGAEHVRRVVALGARPLLMNSSGSEVALPGGLRCRREGLILAVRR